MNQLLANLASTAGNKHVSIPVVLAVGFAIAAIWLPDTYQKKISATEKILIGYGVVAAGNSGPKKDENEKDKTP